MNGMQQEMYSRLAHLDGQTVANLFLEYHGEQLLSYGFREHMQEEGYIEEYEDEDYTPSAPWNAPGMRISDFI